MDSVPFYPTSFANVFSVAALDEYESLTYYSNYGRYVAFMLALICHGHIVQCCLDFVTLSSAAWILSRCRVLPGFFA